MANKGNFLEKYSNYLTRGGKSKQLPLRGRRYSMPPEDRPDTLGIDLGSVAGQVKTSGGGVDDYRFTIKKEF